MISTTITTTAINTRMRAYSTIPCPSSRARTSRSRCSRWGCFMVALLMRTLAAPFRLRPLATCCTPVAAATYPQPMVRPQNTRGRSELLAVALAVILTACSGPPPAVSGPGKPAVTASPAPAKTDPTLVPLAIDAMRQREYPGSDLAIEQTLAAGTNYRRYLASYPSDGLKIFGLLTVPNGPKPATGWPVIIFNHGYIPPTVYRTTERYIAYVDAFARNGYIVFKPDYRGFGSSQGTPVSAYYSPDDTVDVLNAVTTMQRYANADPNRIGMWGHSMGGNITLRALVIDPRIKVAVIWAGVNATYKDLLENWQPPAADSPPPSFGRSMARKIIAAN